jgi:opacity protein-like surface antigen
MAQRARSVRWLVAAAAAALLVATPTAQAQEGGDLGGFFIEIPIGLGTPVGESGYESLYDSSFWTGVNLGYLFSLGGWSAAIGPAVDLQYAIGNVDGEWQSNDATQDDLYLGRLRAIGGARFVVGFGSAYLLTRVGIGLDFVHASWDYWRPGNQHVVGDHSDTSFGIVAGIGMGYQITELIGVTFLLDFPIGFHDEGSHSELVNWNDQMIDVLASVAVVFNL